MIQPRSSRLKAKLLISIVLAASCSAVRAADMQIPDIKTQRKSDLLNDGIDFGNWDKTSSLCEQLIAKNPTDVDALSVRAQLRAMTGKIDDAMSDCNQILALKPKNISALLTRSQLFYERGDNQASKADLAQVSVIMQSTDSNNPVMERAFALDCLRRALDSKIDAKQNFKSPINLNTARRQYQQAYILTSQKKFDEALVLYSKLKLGHPDAPRLLSWMVWCYVETGNYVLACKTAARVIALAPRFYSMHGAWGGALEELGRSDEAIKHYDIALNINPNYQCGLLKRGLCHYRNGNFDLALADLDAAHKLNEKDLVTADYRTIVYEMRDQKNRAIEECKRQIALDPKNAAAYAEMADIQIAMKNWKDARVSLDYALKIAPNFVGALARRGMVASETGDLKQAIADYDSAIKLDPICATARYNRGILLQKQNQYAAAVADLLVYTRVSPASAYAHCALGCAQVSNGDYAKAITSCTRSIQLNEKRAHPHFSRGLAYAALGKYQLALKDFNWILNKDDNKVALAARAAVYCKLTKSR